MRGSTHPTQAPSISSSAAVKETAADIVSVLLKAIFVDVRWAVSPRKFSLCDP